MESRLIVANYLNKLAVDEFLIKEKLETTKANFF